MQAQSQWHHHICRPWKHEAGPPISPTLQLNKQRELVVLDRLGTQQRLDCNIGTFEGIIIIIIIIILIYPLTARVAGAPRMISQPVSSIFPCSPLLFGTWQTPGLSIPWCFLPTSSSVCLVFYPLLLCLARWFWPDLMNGRHDHTTAVCISLWWSGGFVCCLWWADWSSRMPWDLWWTYLIFLPLREWVEMSGSCSDVSVSEPEWGAAEAITTA